MSENKNKPEIKDYAGGWITEQKGTQVPGFLKIAFPIIGLACTAYFILYINGDVNNTERGHLVRQLDAATTPANGLMYLVAALALIFVITVVLFAYNRHE